MQSFLQRESVRKCINAPVCLSLDGHEFHTALSCAITEKSGETVIRKS